MKNTRISKCITITAVLFITAAIFLINYLTPYIADDYANLSGTVWGTEQALTTFSGLIRSACNFYCSWGGRMEGYIFAKLLLYFPPMIADLLNTLCYMSATLFIYLICKGEHRHSLPLYLGIHILLWICVPDYGQVMFWICGSANYLWTSVIVLSLIYLYRRYSVSEGKLFHSRIYSIPTFLLGFSAGLAMENMSAGMLVILTLYLITFWKHHVGIQLPILTSYLGSLTGFAFLVFAPGNQARSDAEIKLSVLFKFVIISYYWVICVGILCILWLVFCILSMNILPETSKRTVLESLLYLCGAAASAYCMMAAPSSPERTWYIVCVYAVISVGLLYSSLEQYQTACIRKAVRTITAGAMVILSVSMADTMISSFEILTQTKEREAYILTQKELGNLDIYTPVISHQYPLRAKHDALTGLSDITSDPEYWINQAVADYYDVNSITGTEP